MKVLIFGASGQLGNSLKDVRPKGHRVTYAGSEDCDLTDPGAVSALITKVNPEIIVNCAGYTAVDKAEEEPELAFAVNCDAAGYVADNCREGRKLIHISTDFVFDGEATTPYPPGGEALPLCIYGESKLAGETAILERIPEQAMIIRTSWLYSEHGDSFVKTMLRLMSEKDEIGVVDDQTGSPTYARSLAEAVWQMVDPELFTPGIYHWTDQGGISWYDFAKAIQEEAIALDLLENRTPVNAITTDQYPTLAARPKYSVLDNSKLARLLDRDPCPWRDNLRLMLRRLKKAGV